MKHFWILFSIYIAILSVVPCGDNRESKETQCNQETTCDDSACANETGNDSEMK